MEMFTYMHWTKDSSGKVQKCTIRNDATGEINTYDRQVIFSKLQSKEWRIKGLMIDDAQRLRLTNKDELVEEYKKACQILGIAPVTITTINTGEYMVSDVPYDKITKIPDFVECIHVHKRFNSHGQGNVAGNTNANASTQNSKSSLDMLDFRLETLYRYLRNNIEGLINSSTTSQTDITGLRQLLTGIERKVDQLGVNISGVQSDIGQSSNEIEQKMKDMSDVLDEIYQAQGSLNISGELSTLKTEVLDGINQVMTLQNAVKPVLDDMSVKYTAFVNSGGFNQNKIQDFDKITKFIRTTEEDYIMQSRAAYDNFVTPNKPEAILIPYDKLELLRDDVDFLYKTYDIFSEYFDGLKQEEFDYLQDFMSGNNALNKFINVVNEVPVVGSVVGKTTTSLKSIHNTIQEGLIYKKKLRVFTDIYTNSNIVLDQFYCDKDADIIKFLFEYKVLKKNENGSYSKSLKGNSEKDKLVHYRLLFRTIHAIKQKQQIVMNEEVIKRLTVAYILSEKILRNEVQLLNITDYYMGDNKLDATQNGHLDTLTIRKYKGFHNSILYVLMHSVLILLGYTPESSYTYFISTMKGLDPRQIIDMDYQDIQNMSFEYSHYESRLQGV